MARLSETLGGALEGPVFGDCCPTDLAGERLPDELADCALELSADGSELTYSYDSQGDRIGIVELLDRLGAAGIEFRDLHTAQSSLEDIFVSLVRERA